MKKKPLSELLNQIENCIDGEIEQRLEEGGWLELEKLFGEWTPKHIQKIFRKAEKRLGKDFSVFLIYMVAEAIRLKKIHLKLVILPVEKDEIGFTPLELFTQDANSFGYKAQEVFEFEKNAVQVGVNLSDEEDT